MEMEMNGWIDRWKIIEGNKIIWGAMVLVCLLVSSIVVVLYCISRLQSLYSLQINSSERLYNV